MDISKKIKETIEALTPQQKKKAKKCIEKAKTTEPVGRPPDPRRKLIYKETVKKVKGPRGRGTVESAKELLKNRIEYYEKELGEKLTEKEINSIFSDEIKKIAAKEAIVLGPKYQSRIVSTGVYKDEPRVVGSEKAKMAVKKRELTKKILEEREGKETMGMEAEEASQRAVEKAAKAEAAAKEAETAAKEAEAAAKEAERERKKAKKERESMGEEDALSKAAAKEADRERRRLKKAENERKRKAKADKIKAKEVKGSGRQELKSLRQNLVLQLIRPINQMVQPSNMNTREF
jgi:hypothetical protein